jgi:hypothetical protein
MTCVLGVDYKCFIRTTKKSQRVDKDGDSSTSTKTADIEKIVKATMQAFLSELTKKKKKKKTTEKKKKKDAILVASKKMKSKVNVDQLLKHIQMRESAERDEDDDEEEEGDDEEEDDDDDDEESSSEEEAEEDDE